MNRLSLLALVCVLIFSATIAAQPNDATKPAPKDVVSNSKPAKDPEAERILKERRENAQSLLINLASDAGRFNDQTLRARTQARIADVLWEVDRERARAMFRAAWEAAEIADRENAEREQEDIRQQQGKTGGSYVLASPPDLRREVLRLAAKRDRTLGEEFLGKFKLQKQEEATAKTARRNPFGTTDEAVSQRLMLAREMVGAGDTERGLQFADPVLGTVNMQAIDFLSFLREKDAAAADQRYAVMLANAASNLQSDANTVSLLSSYIFTPHLYVRFYGSAAGMSQMAALSPPANVAPELRAAFFRVASSILLRPLAPTGQDQTTAGVDGQYLILKRLMPLFEQYAPPEIKDAVRAQLEALSSMASNSARQRDDDEWVNKGVNPEKPTQDQEQSLLDQIDHAKTADERDRLNLHLALLLAGKGDLRARDYVDKIDDIEVRKNSRAHIDASMAILAVNKKDTARALEIARTGELNHLQRAWLLSQTAKLLVKSDRDKALALIEDAATEARRIDGSDPDRARAFFAVANAVLTVNRPLAWDAMEDAVKSANSAENFTGEDGQMVLRLISKAMSAITNESVPDFDLAPIFSNLAKDDYGKTVELARGFQREAPRANATIAIARSVLEDKKK